MDYDLDKLGWADFEGLIQVLLSLRLGLGVEGWGGSGDWGRDAYCSSSLQYPGKKVCKGPFLFQCKFVSAANAAGARPEPLVAKAARAERDRIAKRIAGKSPAWVIPPKHYGFITNSPLGGETRATIENELKGVMPTANIHIHDGTDVCNWIRITPEATRAFPQLFSLVELFSYLREGRKTVLSARSEAAAQMAVEESRIFVPTKAYEEAWSKLQKHAFVILEGPPEVGKTAIGRMIALALVKRGWEGVECRNPQDFQEAYRSSEHQVFIADDFFGRTDYEPSRVSGWQDELPYILRRLDTRHWLILTSRAHLLQMGKADLDVSGQNEHFPDPGEVIVDAGKLSRLEKARILYRHAKHVGLSEEVKQELKDRVEEIIDHKHFTPLRIHKLVVTLSQEYP